MSNEDLNNNEIEKSKDIINSDEQKSLSLSFFASAKNNYYKLKEEIFNSNNSVEKNGIFRELIFYSIFNFIAPLMAIKDTISNFYITYIYNRIPKFFIKYQIYSFIIYILISSIVYFFCKLIGSSKVIYYVSVILFIILIMKGYNRVVDNRRNYLKFIRNRSNIFGKFALSSMLSRIIVFFIAIVVGFNLPVYFYMLDSYLEFLFLIVVLFLFIYLSKLISHFFINYYISSYNDNKDFDNLSKVIDLGNNESNIETNIFKKQKESRYNYYSLIISRRIASLLLSLTFSYYYIFYSYLFTAEEYKHILSLLQNIESNQIAYIIAFFSNSLELFLTQIINSDYTIDLPPIIMKYSLVLLYIIYVVIGYGTFFGIISMVDFLSKDKYEFKEFEYVRNRKRISNFLTYSFFTIILFFSIFMMDNLLRNNMNLVDMKRTILNLEDGFRKSLNVEYSERYFSYSTNSNLLIEEEKVINHLIKDTYIEFINKYKEDVDLYPEATKIYNKSINIISPEISNRIRNLEKVMKERDLKISDNISKITISLNRIKDRVVSNCETTESIIVIDQGVRKTSTIRVFNKRVEYCMYKEFENEINLLIKDLNLSPILNKY